MKNFNGVVVGWILCCGSKSCWVW